MCQKALMFLTDGEDYGFDDYASIKEKALKSDAYIFSYALGDNAAATVAKRLACENRGVFYPVSDDADLAQIMARYFEFFAQGQEICHANFVKYSHTASGNTLYGACQPLYDRTQAGQRSMLGVSCLDVNLISDISEAKKQAGWNHFVCQASDISKTCRSVDLSECHLQKIRAAYSPESVCPGPTHETEQCACSDPSCQDDPTFRDEQQFFCDTWIGDACTDENAVAWGYSMAGMAKIREKCPRSCGLCAWKNPCPPPVPGECPTVSVASECRACVGNVSGYDLEGNCMTCPPDAPSDPMKDHRCACDDPNYPNCNKQHVSAASSTLRNAFASIVLFAWGFLCLTPSP